MACKIWVDADRDGMKRPAVSIYLLGEMTIRLDDVACLIGIPIIGRLLHDRELTRDEEIQMMQEDLLLPRRLLLRRCEGKVLLMSVLNNRSINLLWLLALQDMNELDSWSWGGMELAFLYEQLSLITDSSVASCGGYMTLLVGWALAHFTNLIPRIHNDDYEPALAPLVDQWKPPRGFFDPGHYRDVIDSMDHSHVIWRSYER
ncbi:protein MAIN-LIKE 2-like [Medicago truncatula]|uniref:protein MAIN-LIKE 2-like n=1 Tax=Medicago truncatula TaxID=3880 RepID=UPI001967805E|nr:protein MAIN-LIKE 2-like [Medicago truncatula]